MTLEGKTNEVNKIDEYSRNTADRWSFLRINKRKYLEFLWLVIGNQTGRSAHRFSARHNNLENTEIAEICIKSIRTKNKWRRKSKIDKKKRLMKY